MKKFLIKITVLFLILFLNINSFAFDPHRKIKVSVTSSHLYCLLKEICADKLDLTLMVTPIVCPNNSDIDAAMIKRISTSNVILYHLQMFCNFANMEKSPTTLVRKKERMNYSTAFDLNGKTPPQAIEIEEAVLGSLMLDSNALNMTIETLYREYFYKPEHQYVFDAIRKLFEDSYPVDLMTVVERLRQSGTLEMAGGAYNVAQLTNNVVSSAHIEYHVRILNEKYIQRELIRTSTETITQAYQETTDVVWLLDNTEQKLMDINDKNFRSDYKPVGNLVTQAMKQIEEIQTKEGGVSGQQTGFTALESLPLVPVWVRRPLR